MKYFVSLITRHTTSRLNSFQAHQDTLSTRCNKFNENDPNVAITKVSTEKIFSALWMKGTAVGNAIKDFEYTYIYRLTIPISP